MFTFLPTEDSIANRYSPDQAFTQSIVSYEAGEYQTAFNWAKQSAKGGMPAGQRLLADYFYYGIGTVKDLSPAVEWYRISARNGDTDAQYMLGAIYLNEDLYKGLESQAVSWLVMASRAGHIEANRILAYCYLSGTGTEEDFDLFEKHALFSAGGGSITASYMLGDYYGRNKQYTNAAVHLNKAADSGHKQAQFLLGVMYADGLGFKPDPLKASEWYHKAALQGHTDAQYNLSLLYYAGEGVEKDLEKAAIWMALVAKTGDQEAIDLLAKIENDIPIEQRDEVKVKAYEFWESMR
jgi:TPR repeat protein